jgi:hypothetical protein
MRSLLTALLAGAALVAVTFAAPAQAKTGCIYLQCLAAPHPANRDLPMDAAVEQRKAAPPAYAPLTVDDLSDRIDALQRRVQTLERHQADE